jgi:hypothetical protein
MTWPEKPTCHADAGEPHYQGIEAGWKPPTERVPYRHCYYCGSLHPEDLLAALAEGDRLGGSDWKYGWPHKFYLYPPVGHGMHKWYNQHLLDQGYSEQARDELILKLEQHSGILFWFEGGQLHYRAPSVGYQR